MCLKPYKRKEYCDKTFRKADYDNDANLKDFGLHVKAGMIMAPARVLPPPKLMYGQKRPVQPRDGAWNMVGDYVIAYCNYLCNAAEDVDAERTPDQAHITQTER